MRYSLDIYDGNLCQKAERQRDGKFSRRFFTINRARITSGTRKAFRIIPDGVAQYSDECIGASRWRMSIEKPKRSLCCSFARLGPGSGMALETHPRDFGTKSSARNSGISRLSRSPHLRISCAPLAASRSARNQKLHTVVFHKCARLTQSKAIAKIRTVNFPFKQNLKLCTVNF